MNAQQRFVLVLGLGLIAAGIYFRRQLVQSVSTVVQSAPDIAKRVEGSVMTTASSVTKTAARVWQSIPAAATPFMELFERAERSFGIPATLLTRMGWIESRFNPGAINTKSGAAGIMQILPSAHPGVKANQPEIAIPYAGKYLKALYNQFGSWSKAVAAYNWGPGNLQKSIAQHGDKWRQFLPSETKNYLNLVEAAIDLPA
jgi:soluble lytic murein transglycosylase-like protein